MNTAQMPQPGDLITAFSVQVGRCFRMVYSEQLQATHCYQTPEWKGPVEGRKGAFLIRGGHAGSTRRRSARKSLRSKNLG